MSDNVNWHDSLIKGQEELVTCVGTTNDGYRCRNPIAQLNRDRLAQLCAKLSILWDGESIHHHIEGMAALSLCRRNHQNQAQAMVQLWLPMIYALKDKSATDQGRLRLLTGAHVDQKTCNMLLSGPSILNNPRTAGAGSESESCHSNTDATRPKLSILVNIPNRTSDSISTKANESMTYSGPSSRHHQVCTKDLVITETLSRQAPLKVLPEHGEMLTRQREAEILGRIAEERERVRREEEESQSRIARNEARLYALESEWRARVAVEEKSSRQKEMMRQARIAAEDKAREEQIEAERCTLQLERDDLQSQRLYLTSAQEDLHIERNRLSERNADLNIVREKLERDNEQFRIENDRIRDDRDTKLARLSQALAERDSLVQEAKAANICNQQLRDQIASLEAERERSAASFAELALEQQHQGCSVRNLCMMTGLGLVAFVAYFSGRHLGSSASMFPTEVFAVNV